MIRMNFIMIIIQITNCNDKKDNDNDINDNDKKQNNNDTIDNGIDKNKNYKKL